MKCLKHPCVLVKLKLMKQNSRYNITYCPADFLDEHQCWVNMKQRDHRRARQAQFLISLLFHCIWGGRGIIYTPLRPPSKVFNRYRWMLYWGMNVKENTYSIWDIVIQFFTGRCRFRKCGVYRLSSYTCNHAAGASCGKYRMLKRAIQQLYIILRAYPLWVQTLKANCLFCHRLEKTRAEPSHDTYGRASYGRCGTKKIHIRDPIKNCNYCLPIDACNVDAHIDRYQRYLDNFSHILQRMREEKQEWIK